MSRLDVNDPEVFNKWRQLYYDLSVEENIEFGNAMEAKYPEQKSFTPEIFDQYFHSLPFSRRVVEIGGWKGELARQICWDHPEKIKSWYNIDMCKAAVDKPCFALDKYTADFPVHFDWFRNSRLVAYDVCVSAHTIEHLTGMHLRQLLDWISGIPNVIFEAPITEKGQSWNGYQGTHILELGWEGVVAEMFYLKYSARKLSDTCYAFSL